MGEPAAPPRIPRPPWWRTRLVASTLLAVALLAAGWLAARPGGDARWWLWAQFGPVAFLVKIYAIAGKPVQMAVMLPAAAVTNGVLLRALWALIRPPPAPQPGRLASAKQLGCLGLLTFFSFSMVVPPVLGAREKARAADCDRLWTEIVNEARAGTLRSDRVNPRDAAQPGITSTPRAVSCQVRVEPLPEGRVSLSQQVRASAPARTITVVIEGDP